MDRPWMKNPNSDLIRRAIDYFERLMYETPDGLPEADAELAEAALSLVAGLYGGMVGPKRVMAQLEEIRQRLDTNPHSLWAHRN